jgi:hypothetical protein
MKKQLERETKGVSIATLKNRWTDNLFTVCRIENELFLCDDSNIVPITNEEIIKNDNYIITKGSVGIAVHGGDWVLCHPNDDMHEMRMIKDGRVINPCGDPLGRVKDYINIRMSRSLDYNLSF